MTSQLAGSSQPKRTYSPPKVTVMSEEEVLRTFQLTSAMAGWWVPGGTPTA